MQITKEINVELQEDKQTRIVHAIQYDTNSRKIKINLMEGAEKYVIETGVIATIYAIKPSGLSIYNNCVISDNSIIATLTTQMLAENGTVNCQIELVKGSQVLTSFEFAISVKRSVVKSNAIESEDESTVFVELIRQANEATTSANSAAESATDAAIRAQEIVDDAELILNGDLSNKTVAFTQAASRVNIANGESFKVMFGKIQKFFTDLSVTGIGAFAKITNNLTTSTTGTLLDASQGYAVNNMITNLTTRVNNLGKELYPVGALYMSTITANPSTYIGGTWVAWGTGKVPVAVDTSQTEFNTVEKSGGAKTHTLSTNEMPIHNHQSNHYLGSTSGVMQGYLGVNGTISGVATSSTGGGAAHNNLQPYITCYMWKRTA